MEQQRNKLAGKYLYVLLALITIWAELALFSLLWNGTYEDRLAKELPLKASRSPGSENTCTVYMAPSSVHGIESMGIYTTKNLSKRSSIINAVDGLSIPVYGAWASNGHESKKMQEARNSWNKLFDEYWWGRGISDQMIWEADGALDLKMSFGQLPNHHCILHSLDLRNPRKGYNDALVNRTIDPGAGSFSYHIGREFSVHRDVQAGEELFLNYGHCEEWKEGDLEWAKYVLIDSDYEAAARVTKRTWKSISKLTQGTMKQKQTNLGTSKQIMDPFTCCCKSLVLG